MYSAATAVLMNEILKGLISLVIAFTRTDGGHGSMYDMAQAPFPAGSRGAVGRLRKLWREVFSPDCWKLSIPAILYGASRLFLISGKYA
jgi:UDP-sugar transporter A1/2/3